MNRSAMLSRRSAAVKESDGGQTPNFFGGPQQQQIRGTLRGSRTPLRNSGPQYLCHRGRYTRRAVCLGTMQTDCVFVAKSDYTFLEFGNYNAQTVRTMVGMPVSHQLHSKKMWHKLALHKENLCLNKPVQ
ncbi:hypothetical protein NDU88_007652 [Pleurodeles waltl]|uniref:Uncharacterized protein n=1 Tax=Pleurodeles waltl TaxID=8319 RepID=A0AAV7N6H7_PLEWA|nr:hypothetical protein NDU88_007652 [Pleurodeles waltl]